MIKAVLDTNVLISALVQTGGLEASVLRYALEQRFTVCLSKEIFQEYTEVLGRKKFLKYQERASAMLADLSAVAVIVAPQHTLAVSRDPDDNCFLECAEAAGAAYLVTGNVKDFPENWKGTRIASARIFLNDCGWLDDLG